MLIRRSEKFTAPEIKVVYFDVNDVIATSCGPIHSPNYSTHTCSCGCFWIDGTQGTYWRHSESCTPSCPCCH